MIRDDIKTYIESEVNKYIISGASFTFLEENKLNTYALASEMAGQGPCTKWIYPFNIEISVSLGERSQYSEDDLKAWIDAYRRSLGELLATNDEILYFDTEVVKLESIRSFSQIKEDMNYYIRIYFEYSHSEVYFG